MPLQIDKQGPGSSQNPRRSPLPALAIALALAAALLSAWLTPAARATQPPPEITRPGTITEIHATYAVTTFGTVVPSSEAEGSTAYSTSETGPWIEVQRCGPCSEPEARVTRLKPETKYYVRFYVENAAGHDEEVQSFTTADPEPPEVNINCNPEGFEVHQMCEVGPTYAEAEAHIESGGLETEYRFEYSTAESGPYTLFNSTGSGTITPAEAFADPRARATGIEDETLYYLRVTATNALGSTQEILPFETEPLKPHPVTLGGARDVAADFVYLGGNFNTHGSEAHWRFEYATNSGGPWTVGPEGTVSTAEAVAASELAADHSSFVGPVKLAGLSPATAYYIRLRAENAYGVELSRTGEITTAGPPSEVQTLEAHAIHGESVRALATFKTNSQPIDELQQIAVNGGASGGTYTLSFGGETTGPIPFNARSGAIEDALRRLTSIGPNGLVGVDSDEGKRTVEFRGPLAGTDQPQLVADSSGLTPSGSVAISTLQDGFSYHSRYHFDYVTEEQFQADGFTQALTTPAVELQPSAPSMPLVGQDLTEAEAGRTYRYRIVAGNSTPGDPIIDGSVGTLTVPVAAPAEAAAPCPNQALRLGPSAKLPDCRAFEQITPADKRGTMDIYHYGAAVNDVPLLGADGDHLSLHAPGVEWGESPDPRQSNYFFSRTPTGWSTISARPPGTASADYYEPLVHDASFSRIGVEAGWFLNGISQSKNIEFLVGPPGGPYEMAAEIARSKVTPEQGWAGESADGSKLILQTEDHKLTGQSTGTTSGEDLYEFTEGQLRQLNVLTDGQKISTCGARLAGGPDALSADGQAVFFIDNCTHHLYLRSDGSTTVDLGESELVATDSDASRLLLETRSGGEDHAFLYQVEGSSLQQLFSFKADQALQAGSLVASADLSILYFATPGSLTADAPPTDQSTKNVYEYVLGAPEPLRFIDQATTTNSIVRLEPSPSGRFLYVEARGLGGLPGFGDQSQGFLFDSRSGSILCPACASPLRPEGAEFAPASAASADGSYVFFDTYNALLPQDVDGEEPPSQSVVVANNEHESPYYSISDDVYEWRANGVDACSRIQGCISLITTGQGGFFNQLFGTSSSGRDVYFTTHESLVAQDVDTAGDIYDARSGGGYPPPPPRPIECEGDSCSNPVPAPNDTTPSSLTYRGPGNHSQARKRHHRRRHKHSKHRRRTGHQAGHHQGGKK